MLLLLRRFPTTTLLTCIRASTIHPHIHPSIHPSAHTYTLQTVLKMAHPCGSNGLIQPIFEGSFGFIRAHSGSFGLLCDMRVPIFLSKNTFCRAHSVHAPPFNIILLGGRWKYSRGRSRILLRRCGGAFSWHASHMGCKQC